MHTINYLNDTPSFRKNKHLNAYDSSQIDLLHSEVMSAYTIDDA